MAIEEHLPPACAFAISVLQERETDPEGVPEEAVEAAQQHLATCIRCLSSPPVITPPPRKKKRRRPAVEDGNALPTTTQLEESLAPAQSNSPKVTVTAENVAQAPTARPAEPGPTQVKPEAVATPTPRVASEPKTPPQPQTAPAPKAPAQPEVQKLPAVLEGLDGLLIDCAQCRQLLPDYVEAMDNGRNVAELYPEVHDHLLICDSGCLVLLDLFRQEAKANRKYRRRPVRDPFSAIGWELSGFFRTGQIPMGPMALAYGTLILMLIVASLSAFLAIRWDDARYYHPPVIPHTIPTPDGIGLSDGLHIYDACNATSYQDKRAAIQAFQQHNPTRANNLLSQASSAVATDTTGCNGAEAAIYRADLQVRQSGHPFGVLVVSFDSGPGVVTPGGGTDRHILYAAYTQELIGAYIAQAQYNSTQMSTAGAPLLYLVLANTAGEEQGALQIANTISSMASAPNLAQFGLLASGQAPLLGVLGLAPSSLLQVALPVLCRAGVPVISPTATGLFIVDQLENTSMYQHCAPGFAFVRFSADDANQSHAAANYAYDKLGARNVAVFYDPSNPSSQGSAQSFISNFTQHGDTRIVAQETAVSNGLVDSDGKPEASSAVLLAGLNDALQAKHRPDVIYAPMLTNDVITLAQAIAKLPTNQQPALLIGGEFVHPAALQALTQWTRQQQLTLPRIYVALTSAARPPVSPWQKAFYASFCNSFATPGSFCSGTAALDQGALLFADGVEMVGQALDPALTTGSTTATQSASLPTPTDLIKKLSQENFAGVSCQIAVHLRNKVLITSTSAEPVILGVQPDGSLQIVG
jgi:lysophospholipase L1-like esterase